MNERRSGDMELRTYLDGKFAAVIEALNEHKLENMKDITTLQNKAEKFEGFINANADAARDRKNLFWTAVGANVMAAWAIVWHFIRHFGDKR